VVLNFLAYLLTHDVCPEYTDDISGARAICQQAKTELPAVFQLSKELPGPFNLAARTLYQPKIVDEFAFGNPMNQGMDEKTAKRIFMATVASSEKLTDRVVRAGTIECLKTFQQVYEVTKLTLPAENPVEEIFHRGVQTSTGEGKNGTTPCGWMSLVPSKVEDGWDNERPRAPDALDMEVFLLEVNLMKQLREGMKLSLVVGVLNIGLRFISEAREVYPTFYTFLPQELMINYREPAPNHRNPPSIDNPDADAEEAAMAKEMSDSN
jgi:hypothetical protein